MKKKNVKLSGGGGFMEVFTLRPQYVFFIKKIIFMVHALVNVEFFFFSNKLDLDFFFFFLWVNTSIFCRMIRMVKLLQTRICWSFNDYKDKLFIRIDKGGFRP